MFTASYKAYRCPHDQKLLFKGILIDSEVEVKCRDCKQLVVLRGEPVTAWLCKKEHCPNRIG